MSNIPLLNNLSRYRDSETDYDINWLEGTMTPIVHPILCKVSMIRVGGLFTPTYVFIGYTDDMELIDKLLLIKITNSEYVGLSVFKVENMSVDNDLIRNEIRHNLTDKHIDTNIDQVL